MRQAEKVVVVEEEEERIMSKPFFFRTQPTSTYRERFINHTMMLHHLFIDRTEPYTPIHTPTTTKNDQK
jgi:hypothetical protein